MLAKLIWIALAGAVGTLARYGLASLVHQLARGVFPWGTLAVNLLGCLLFGAVWSLTEDRWSLSPELRVAVLVGFLGAFTTFSTFMFETGQLLRDSQWLFALGNLAFQNALGLVALFIGFALGRLI